MQIIYGCNTDLTFKRVFLIIEVHELIYICMAAEAGISVGAKPTEMPISCLNGLNETAEFIVKDQKGCRQTGSPFDD